jgi:uncharacterized protein
MLPITLTTAAAAALLNLWLAMRAGRVRMQKGVMIGDGGDRLLLARMRAHANFTEYAPFVLILLGLVEMARGSQSWLWAVSIAFIVARLLHPFGLDRGTPNAMRAIGVGVTALCLLVLAGYALAIPYLDGQPPLTTVAAPA